MGFIEVKTLRIVAVLELAPVFNSFSIKTLKTLLKIALRPVRGYLSYRYPAVSWVSYRIYVEIMEWDSDMAYRYLSLIGDTSVNPFIILWQ